MGFQLIFIGGVLYSNIATNCLLMLQRQIMIMGTPKMTSMTDQTDIILDNTKLERITKNKFLGVIIDENLTWKNHIDGITKQFLGT